MKYRWVKRFGKSILLANAMFMFHLFYSEVKYGSITYYEPVKSILYLEVLLVLFGLIYGVYSLIDE